MKYQGIASFYLLVIAQGTPTNFVWAPENVWNAWGTPLIQVTATGVLFLCFGVVCYRIAKAFFKK